MTGTIGLDAACPFHAGDASVSVDLTADGYKFVVCADCGARGPTQNMVMNAITDWNIASERRSK